MKIGITLRYLDNFEARLFSNGLYQNIFTLYNLLKNIGYTPVICIGLAPEFDNCKKSLSEMGFDSIEFKAKEIKNAKLDLIIEAGTVIDSLDGIRSVCPNIKVVALLYGNPYFPRIENVIFNKEVGSSSMAAKREGVWVSPHFEFSKEFLKAMSGVEEVKTAPFIWTPKYMDKSLEERGFDRESFIKNLKPAGDIAVLEPNINILKTSIIPSMIIESLYNEHPELIKSGMCYGSYELIESKTANTILSNLNCVKKKVLTVEHRYKFADIFTKWSGSIVSHQHYNELNYVYLEALHYNIPLIHNSPFFKDVGYYYDEFNISEGKEALKEAILTHKYRSQEKRELEEYHVNKFLDTNQKNINGYKELIESLF